MFGHVTTQRVRLFVLCCVFAGSVHRAGVRLGDVCDFMIRLLMVGNTAQCAYCTVYLLHSVLTAQYTYISVPTAQCTYCTVCILHCSPIAQCTYCTVYLLHSVLLHNVPTAQCAYCTVYLLHSVLLHSVPIAQCTYCTVYYCSLYVS